MIPLAMLAAPTEVRAVTPTPGASCRPNRLRRCKPVFSYGRGCVPWYRPADSRTWAQAVYPVLTSRPTVGGPHVGSDDVGDTTGAFSADLLPPKRIQASFIYRRTDAMQFSGMD